MKQLVFTFLLLLSITKVYSQTEVELRLKLNKGDSYLIENNIVSITEQDIMGEKQIIKKNEFSSFFFTVLNQANVNSYYIKVTYKQFKTEIDNQNSIEKIDTDSINDTSVLNNFFTSLINKSYYIEINTKGEILKVDSLNYLINLEAIDELDVNTKTILIKQFREEAIRNIPLLTRFPNEIIQEKESWSFKDTTQINILNIFDTKHILQEITNKTYIINNTSEIYTDKNESLHVNNFFINYNMKGNSVSSKILDKSSCMINESITTQHVKGTAGMKYSEDSENAYTWPIKITNTISVKASKIEKHEQ